MNPRFAYAVAALSAACTVALAEPVASVSRSDPTADAIAQALVADASLQGSKITVQPDDGGVILLTGVTPTWAQMRKAVDVATRQAGQGKVVNAIATEEVFVDLTRLVVSEQELSTKTAEATK